MSFQTIKRQIKKHLGTYINPNFFILTKKYVNIVEMNFNAALGRHFLFPPRLRITIETSGLCNLSCKFCAYSKKELAKVIMPLNLFQEVVNQAAEMGFSIINLTPLTGDVFMDKGIIEKMQYLDNHPKIKGYDFFTNFVVPDEQKIKELFGLRKLNFMHVSLYGHDEKSFCEITRATKKEYHRLVRNLKCLYELYDRNNSFSIQMNWRSVPDFSEKSLPKSELQEIVLNFEKTYGIVCENIFLYTNWGGEVTNEDVKDVGLRVNDGSNVYKKGLCNLIFHFGGVLADGRVDACVCRDVNGSLVVGDINKEPLSHILSLNNPLYADIIQEQMESKFRPVCQSCDLYQSLYKPIRWGSNPDKRYYNLNQVKALLSQ
jgi:MoaA/NifB/PqqE/SkfB family radical SAM enzyme